MIEIGLILAGDSMRESVDQMGDTYVYPRANSLSCAYVHDVEDQVDDEYGHPVPSDYSRAVVGCIAAHALVKCGLTLEQIGGIFGETNEDTGVAELSAVLQEQGIARLTDDAVKLLEDAQNAQDRGETWGHAQRMAWSQFE
jgi:hypothetical protein